MASVQAPSTSLSLGSAPIDSRSAQLRSRCASTIANQLREDHCVVVLSVAGCVHDRERAISRAGSEFLDAVGVSGELRSVTRTELIEPLGHMVEPSAQLIAWGQLACPVIELGS